MNNKWDVIVIGAGLGGLSAAGLVAIAGKKVLVLEQSDKPGGYASTFKEGDFTFDFSLHSLDGVAPGGWAYGPLKMLGVLDRLEFERLDPYYVAHFPEHTVTAAANPIEYEANLIRLFPKEADGIRALCDTMVAIYRDAHRIQADEALDRDLDPEAMLDLYPSLIRYMGESWAAFMGRFISDPKLKAIISPHWTYCGFPPSRLNAATFALLWASAHYYGAFYPRGGSTAVSRAIEAVIKENGGEVLYGHKVTQIHVKDGLVTKVSTDQGFEAEAPVFISNANVPDTFLKLIDPEQLPAGYRARIEVTPDSLSTFNIYVGLDRDLTKGDWPLHKVFVADGYDLEAQFAATLAGDWAHVPLLLTNHAAADPGSAPEGKSALTIMCLAPWNYRDTWGTGGDVSNYRENPKYQQIKEEVADCLLVRLESLIPGLRESIVCKSIATPLTNARYTGNRGGAIFGFEQSVDGMYQSRLNEETPIPNLFLSSAWTNPGGGQSAVMISGRDAAGHCLRYLKKTNNGASPVAAPAPIQSDATSLVGQPAPNFKLPAIGSLRDVGLNGKAHPPMALIFVTQNTTNAIGEVNAAVRSCLPMATQATVATVVDLGAVPKLFHGMIKFALKRSYQQAAKDIPDLFDPADYVLILPDWTGNVVKDYQIQGIDKQAAVVVIDRAGYVRGVFQGDNLGERTANVLKWM